jgi:DNA-binding NtrC family response regulator
LGPNPFFEVSIALKISEKNLAPLSFFTMNAMSQMSWPLLSKYLDVIIDSFPADRMLAVFFSREGDVALEKSKKIEWGSDQDVSNAIISRALRARQPVMMNEGRAEGGGDHPLSESVPAGAPAAKSVLCLPIVLEGPPAGVIYFEKQGNGHYSRDHMEWLAALSGPIHFVLRRIINGDQCGRPGSPPPNQTILGGHWMFDRIRTLIDRVKDSDAPVFISGESGTGKELVARTIHESGQRKKGKFVAVNCGAIPDNLLESELFGCVRGAFTGAVRDRAGLIEEANGGTFFLDEVGDLTLHLQAKLLRVLQEKEIRRVGENRVRPVDARFISATNKDLEKEIRGGAFREDLLYRLKIIAIEIPPLRERREDILLFLNHFLDRYSGEMKRERPYFSPRALELLLGYPWPGNVRELQNEVQKCLIYAGEGNLIREEFLSAKINPQVERYAPSSALFTKAKADFEKRFLREALSRCGYHRARTAAEIGLTRQGLFKLMRKHGIEPPA